jgi:branched-chain amino acid transport system substrate-binding protein
MSSLPPATFASSLRRYRQAAGLTQEELAERARLSVQAIGALERGDRRTPRKETIDLLAEALSLTESERAAFEAAARQQRLANSLTSTALTPAAAPPETIESPPETAEPPEELLLPLSSPSALARLVRRARALKPGTRGKLLAALCIVLLGTGLLAGSHAFSSGGTLCLATDFPTKGQFGDNKSLEDAIKLAVMRYQSLGNGYQLRVSTYDDTSLQADGSDPQTSMQNVQQIAQNPCMLGIIGPYFSSAAAAVMPIAAAAGLVVISPSNTVPGLTLRSYAMKDGYNFDQLHPAGKPINYFRISATDVMQGVVAANFTFGSLGTRSAYVVSDRTAYGEELADGFTQGFEAKGGGIVGIDRIPNGNASIIADVAAKIVATQPEEVFYGGAPWNGGGLLKAQLVKLGYTGPFVGGDALTGYSTSGDPTFLAQVGASTAVGSFATVPAFPLPFSTSVAATRFIQDYSAHYPGQSVLALYTAEAYDAAMVLITAIKQLIQVGHPVTRAAMIEQVRHIQYTGVIGPISFDDQGDIAHGVFSVYAVRAGQWVYYQQVSA